MIFLQEFEADQLYCIPKLLGIETARLRDLYSRAMRLKADLGSDAVLMLTTVIWGSTFVIAKDVLEQWPPVAYLMMRFSLAALVLFALFPRQVFVSGLRE